MRSAGGAKKARKIRMWSRRNEAGESSMLMRFVEPADVRGTGFLQIEHKGGDDDRRLFLPALRRVQRISASGRGGNFMSSDFTYYDVGRPKVADWSYTEVEGQEVAGVKCRGIQGVPASDRVREDTGYGRVTWYVDPERLLVLRAVYRDRDGMDHKVLDVLEVEVISGTPFGTRMRMKDVGTGHVSEMRFAGLKTDQGLAESLFTERNLKRWTR